MEDAIFRFHGTKKDDPIMVAINLFGTIINIHRFEDGNGKICRLILAHVLIQMKCCLFPVILSSFHWRGRRHDIMAVKYLIENLNALHHDYKVFDTLLGYFWAKCKDAGWCWHKNVGWYPPADQHDLARTQNLITMSLELFQKVPAGATETVFDDKTRLCLKGLT